jgi:hypothetical protein
VNNSQLKAGLDSMRHLNGELYQGNYDFREGFAISSVTKKAHKATAQ